MTPAAWSWLPAWPNAAAVFWSRWPGVTKSPCWGVDSLCRPASASPSTVPSWWARTASCWPATTKIHLFDVDLPDGNTYRESETVQPGTALPPVVDVPGLCRVGLSICYDVRFPELYRHLAGAGAELVMIPAAFTAFTGKDHWQVLLQARAIENTAYVLAPAQTGLHYGRRQTHGHALVIDPWGTVLADAGVSVGLAVAPIDTSHGQRVRAQMPSLNHRCPSLF